jgi:hypothetical protein
MLVCRAILVFANFGTDFERMIDANCCGLVNINRGAEKTPLA